MDNMNSMETVIDLVESSNDENDDCIIISSQQKGLDQPQPYELQRQSQIRQQLEETQNQKLPLFIKFNSQSPQRLKQKLRRCIPWMTEETASINDSLIRFHNEVIDFYNYIRPNKSSHQIRILAFNEIKQMIRELMPNTEVHIFGSFATQLYLPDGDIDLCVFSNMKYTTDEVYQKIYYALRKNPGRYTNLNYIRGAKVPIIKFVCRKSKIHFDIAVDKNEGLRQIQFVRRISDEYPEFKYLVFVFKCYLAIRNISETYKGGIGSFLLFSILHVYLQQANRQNQCNCSLGEHIIRFMKFYGETDWSWRVLYVKHGIIQHRQRQIGTFSCISPQDPDRDIGKAAYQAIQIFKSFYNRAQILEATNFKPGQSILAKLLNPSMQKFRYLKEDFDY